MNRQTAGHPYSELSSWLCWLPAFIIGVMLLLALEYLETPRLIRGMHGEELFAIKLIGYANLLLIGSTVLYVSHLWATSEAVGRWASGLAACGALMSLVALAASPVEAYYLHRPGHAALGSLYEIMALFSAITVAIYLVMERVYRTREAGAFVMLIVLGAVLFQIWLAAHDQAIPGRPARLLGSYWMHAHVLANFIGYGAFAVAAAMGSAYLVRNRMPASGLALRSLPDLQRIDELMHKAILLGFPMFTVATLLGAVWAYEAWGRYWAWDPKETWALIVWLTYASYFYFRYVNKWNGRRMAWWTIAGFCLTVFCFLGVSALWPGLHSYLRPGA